MLFKYGMYVETFNLEEKNTATPKKKILIELHGNNSETFGNHFLRAGDIYTKSFLVSDVRFDQQTCIIIINSTIE